MGSLTRVDLRNKTRAYLSSWPIPAKLKVAMNASETTVQFDDDLQLDSVIQNGLLEVEDEIFKVVDRPEESQSIRVHRGYAGTTAAPHNADVPVKIYPSWGWTDAELNDLLRQAIRWLKPRAWIKATSASFTWTANDFDATVPTSSGISFPDGNYIISLEHQESTLNKWIPFRGWKLMGTRLKFRQLAVQDTTLRAEYAQFQANLSDDTTTLDNDEFEEAICAYAAHLAIVSLGSTRIRFAEFAAALNDRASTPDEIIRSGFHLRNIAERAKENSGRELPSGFASTYREPFV